MWILANEIVSRLGLHETLIAGVATLLLTVQSWLVWKKRPIGRLLALAIWVPAAMGIYSAVSGLLDTQELYSYLENAGAINAAQRDLMFARSHRGAVRILLVGMACTGVLWSLLWFGRSRKLAQAPN